MRYKTLELRLRLYVAAVIVVGATAALAVVQLASRSGPPADAGMVVALLLASVLLSSWKVTLSSRSSTMTLGSAAVCLAMVLAGPVVALACAAVGAVVGTTVRPQSGRLWPRFAWADFRPLFNLGNCLLAVSAAVLAYGRVFGELAPVSPDLTARASALVAFQLVYFLANTFGVSAALAMHSGRPLLATWRENFAWTWPGYLVSASVAIAVWSLQGRLTEGMVALLVLAPLYWVYLSYRVYVERTNLNVARMEQEMRHIQELNRLNQAILTSLATAIDAKDRYTRSHIHRVQIYAVRLAEAAGVSGDDLEAIRTASLVHDIGKLGVPERILTKPGKLTPEEFERIQAHVTIGVEILSPVPFPWPVLPLVLSHHERWDGLGYPRGLKGEEIPIGARILAITDVYDALTSDRPYRKALPPERALEVLCEGAGRQFDPELIHIFRRIQPIVREEISQAEAEQAKLARGPEPLLGGEPRRLPRDPSLPSLGESAVRLAGAVSRGEIETLLAETALETAPADTAIYFACRPDGVLEAAAVEGLYSSKLAGLTMNRGEGVSGWVAETLHGQINAQASLDIARRFNPGQAMELSSATAVPVVQGDETLGVLTLYTTGYCVLNESHMQLLRGLAALAAAALHGAVDGEALPEQDELTGLPNARPLVRTLGAVAGRWNGIGEERVPERFCLVLVDLIDLEQIRAASGHLREEALLRRFAELLRAQTRTQDLVCRVAGARFAAVLQDGAWEAGGQLVERLEQAMQSREPEWRDRQSRLVAGFAAFPQDGRTPSALLAAAERRLMAAGSRSTLPNAST